MSTDNCRDAVSRYLEEKGKALFQLSGEELEELSNLKSRQEKSRVLAHDILIMARERGLSRADMEKAFQLCEKVLNGQVVSVENAEVVFDLG